MLLLLIVVAVPVVAGVMVASCPEGALCFECLVQQQQQ